MQRINLGEFNADVVLKDIKNVHLSVMPPEGHVRISAPERMDLDTIRVYAISKIGWIKKERRKLQEQHRESPREYLDRESHFVWGSRYLLTCKKENRPPRVELSASRLTLYARPGCTKETMRKILAAWYREQVRLIAQPMIEKYEAALDVSVEKLFVQQMKTRWGSCNHENRTIRLNTELAKKPEECLEYIVLHEMVHLIEPTHNKRFRALVRKYMPKWELRRDALNRLPVRHENWSY